jgi:hypothetical protein
MLPDEHLKDLLQQLTEVREHLRQLSLHVVQVFWPASSVSWTRRSSIRSIGGWSWAPMAGLPSPK